MLLAGCGGAAASSSGERWRQLADSPLVPRAQHSSVWTGDEVLIWGGSGHGDLDDGAAYNPRTDRWRLLPAAPLAPRQRATAVWTGNEAIFWGGDAGGGVTPYADGAAYDPARNAWRRLPASPLEARFGHTALWTGSEMFVFGGFTAQHEDGEAAAYDPRRAGGSCSLGTGVGTTPPCGPATR
jgi:N-acetylneuraminic acid mutarotase